jgi:hypothetical protein
MRSHLRRVMLVAELDDGSGIIIDSRHPDHPSNPNLTVEMIERDQYDPFVPRYRIEPREIEVTATIDGLRGYFVVRDVADWFANTRAPEQDQQGLAEQPALPTPTPELTP